MIIESGVIVFMGLMLIAIKLPRRTALTLLGKPLFCDVVVTIIATAVHWGTFSGLMAAAVAGLLTSGFTSAMRFFVGYITNGVYKPGVIRLTLDKE